MKNPPHSTQALFQLNGIPPIGISLSMALQHLVAHDRRLRHACNYHRQCRRPAPGGACSFDSGVPGHVRCNDAAGAVPHRGQIRRGTAGHVWRQLCLPAQYAVHRCWWRRHCQHCRSDDRRRRDRHDRRHLRQEDPPSCSRRSSQVLSSSPSAFPCTPRQSTIWQAAPATPTTSSWPRRG